MQATFDIVYMPENPTQEPRVYTLARDLEATDSTHALLRWLKDELGFTFDLAEMEERYEREASCGCEYEIEFGSAFTGRPKRLFRRQPDSPHVMGASIECDPCDEHDAEVGEADPPKWSGEFEAWPHDPMRKDDYEPLRVDVV